MSGGGQIPGATAETTNFVATPTHGQTGKPRRLVNRSQQELLMEAAERGVEFRMRGTLVLLPEEVSALAAIASGYGFEAPSEAIRFAILSLGGTGDPVKVALKIRIQAEVNDTLRQVYVRAATVLGKLAKEIEAEGNL